MAQASRDQAGRTFDVIVVGSGASGGWAAKRLSEAGISVALLDAGRSLTDADYKEHAAAHTLEYRNRANDRIRQTRGRQKDCYACTEYNYDWFVNDNDEPYTTPQGKPFSWQGRTRIIGGRTNVWGRQSYRFSDYDFKAAINVSGCLIRSFEIVVTTPCSMLESVMTRLIRSPVLRPLKKPSGSRWSFTKTDCWISRST